MRDRAVDGHKIRHLREARGLTRHELRRLVVIEGRPISYSHIKYVELNVRAPSDLVARKIAAALGCSIDDFSQPHAGREEAA